MIYLRSISLEVYKYPYGTRLANQEDFLSDKICSYTVKICKKIIKKLKWLVFYGHLLTSVTNGIVRSIS